VAISHSSVFLKINTGDQLFWIALLFYSTCFKICITRLVMDPITAVGLVASAAQLAELAVQVLAKLFQYTVNVKAAPESSRKLRDEIGTSLSLIKSLEVMLGQNPNRPMHRGDLLVRTVDEFRQTLESLDKRVQPSKTRGIGKLTWPLKKEENDLIISRIERYKSALSLTLGIQQG
jgi:hypothetical protein